MKKIIGALLIFTYLTTVGQYTNLVWSDEFDGNTVDLTKWAFQNGDGCPNLCGWGNGELQSYTDDSENISVSNGILTMTAIRENNGDATFTSSKLRTLGLHSWRYGRYEARMKMPLGRGLWPAFWMLSTNTTWPMTGEIDIMEYRGDQPRQTDATLHYGDSWPNNRYDGTSYDHSANLSDDFHIYAVEWDEDQIKWFFDDILIKTETKSPNSLNPESNNINKWPWNTEYYIILNLAVGGTYTGTPTTEQIELTKPTFEVDYIRVYTGEEVEPIAIPGKVEAEDFSNMLGIIPEETSDIGGGSNIGYTDGNDWLEYDIAVDKTANYNFTFRSASESNGGKVTIEIDGTSIGESTDFPVTEGWQTWTSSITENIGLTAGNHKLRFTVIEGSFNLNYIDIVAAPVSGLNIQETEAISIYPTFFENETRIRINSPNTSKLTVKAVNQEGIEIFKSDDYSTNEAFKFGANLTQGMYILYFIYDQKVMVNKITKL